MIQLWLQENYNNIVQWSNNITKGDELHQDLAHYAIEQLLQSPHLKHLEIEEETNEGTIRAFILSIMRNSWYGKKSYFTRYYKLHRADIGQRKRNVTPEKFQALLDNQDHQDYDYYKDELIDAIETVLNDMDVDKDRLWYISRLFKMYLDTPNFSKLSRDTGIPRTSIAKAVEECIEYIKQQLKLKGYDDP